MQKKYLVLQSSGFIGLKENLENQEKIWEIEKSGKTWKTQEIFLENLSTQAKTHGKCLNFRSTCCNIVATWCGS